MNLVTAVAEAWEELESAMIRMLDSMGQSLRCASIVGIPAALEAVTDIEKAKLDGAMLGMDPVDVQQVIDSAMAAFVSHDVGCTLGELVRERMRDAMKDHMSGPMDRWLRLAHEQPEKQYVTTATEHSDRLVRDCWMLGIPEQYNDAYIAAARKLAAATCISESVALGLIARVVVTFAPPQDAALPFVAANLVTGIIRDTRRRHNPADTPPMM